MASASISIVEDVLSEILGGLTIKKACELMGITPKAFLYQINTGGNELRTRYAQAIEARADVLADETIDIADDTSIDPNSARNRIQARQWNAAKTAPKRYGDRIDLNVAQTLDIRAVIADAQSRVLRPICDQQQILDAEVIDTKQLDTPQSPHNELDVDIFS